MLARHAVPEQAGGTRIPHQLHGAAALRINSVPVYDSQEGYNDREGTIGSHHDLEENSTAGW